MEQTYSYKWLARGGTVVTVILCLFMIKAGLEGKFNSVETLQQYIKGFGILAPMILILIQAFQVVVPVLPGFLGCIVAVSYTHLTLIGYTSSKITIRFLCGSYDMEMCIRDRRQCLPLQWKHSFVRSIHVFIESTKLLLLVAFVITKTVSYTHLSSATGSLTSDGDSKQMLSWPASSGR